MRVCECGCEPMLACDELGPVEIWEVKCLGCGTTTGLCFTPDEAMDHWERGDVARFKEWLEEMADER